MAPLHNDEYKPSEAPDDGSRQARHMDKFWTKNDLVFFVQEAADRINVICRSV